MRTGFDEQHIYLSTPESEGLFTSLKLPHLQPKEYGLKRSQTGYELLKNNSQQPILAIPSDQSFEPRLCPQNKLVATTDQTAPEVFRVWDINTQSMVLSLTRKKVGSVREYCFHPTSTEIALISQRDRIFNSESILVYRQKAPGKWKQEKKISTNMAQQVQYSQDCRWIGIVEDNTCIDPSDPQFQTFTLYSCADYKQKWQCQIPVPTAQSSSLYNFAFSPDGNMMAIECVDHIKVYELYNDQPIAVLKGANSCPVFSADNQYLAAKDCSDIHVWRTSDWQPACKLKEINARPKQYSLCDFSAQKTYLSLAKQHATIAFQQRTWAQRSAAEPAQTDGNSPTGSSQVTAEPPRYGN